MKKKLLIIIPILFMVGCTTEVTPEGGDADPIVDPGITIENLDFEDASFNDLTFVYDGNPHILGEVSGVPSDTTITYTGRESYIDVGEYIATASLSKEGYNDKTLTAKLTITSASFSNITFSDLSVEYDGSEHEITAKNIPNFASVTYENNKGTEIGSYNAKATITAKNYNDLVLTASLDITTPLLDFDDIKMEDVTVDYDGKSHTISPTGYPEGTKVTYKGTSSYINAGTYNITCTLSKDGYHDKEVSAKLTINKVEMQGLKFEDDLAFYDGKSHSIKVSGAPSGSTITYKRTNGSGTNTFTAKGTYEIEATVTNKNYETVKLNATLKIIDYQDAVGVDTSKEAITFTENSLYWDVVDTIFNNSYTLRIYSGVRSSEDDPITFDSSNSYREVVSNGEIVYEHTYSGGSLNYHEYDFFYIVDDDVIHYEINEDGNGETNMYKFPAGGMDETIKNYFPAKALVALQPRDDDGVMTSGVDLDDYYSDKGSFEIRDDILFIKHEHVRNGDYIYEIYEFSNIGNSTVVIPSSIIPTAKQIADLKLVGDFYMGGVRYGTHLVSTYNSPNVFMAHTYMYHRLQLIVKPGVHYVMPIIYDKVVVRMVYNYYSEDYDLLISVSGYELNIYFDKDGVYQGEYAELGEITNSASKFTSKGGVIHYYGEW